MSTPAKTIEKSQRPFDGSDAVVAFLRQQGVEVIFGMVGGAIMPVYDAIYRAGAPQAITVGHEQGAAHMGEGFAKATGRPGVLISTSGPGATNLVTGLADAMMDSTPLVALTGQVNSDLMGNDAFQEADMWGITMPITKHNYQITDPEELGQVFAEAFYVAISGRPGPVLIDLPKDVTLAPCQQLLAVPLEPEGYQTHYRPEPDQIERALGLLRKAQRPVILAGGGIIHAEAAEELKALAEKLNIPVTTTLMGLGAFPAGHPLFLGMPGMHGTGYANLALYESDVILAVGCRLDDRVTGVKQKFAPHAQLIHVDVDPSEIGKILPCVAPVEGDAKPVLKAFLAEASAWDPKPDYSPWLQAIEVNRKRYPMTYRMQGDLIAPQWAVEQLGGILGPDTILVTGVGQHQMFTAQFYPVMKPRHFITSGGLGTMGFGFPAALGAKMGRPEKPVVLIDGDGSFLMNIQELNTAVRYRIPVVAVVLNNSYLGMVRQWQHLFNDQRLSGVQQAPPAFEQVAKAFGGLGRSVDRPEDFEGAVRWAMEAAEQRRLPVVLNVKVDPDALVLPMVPAGKSNAEFIPCEGKEA
jgi:acetolactate synthase-1/2/3 large subunit